MNITRIFFKPSQRSMNSSQNDSRAVIMISPHCYQVNDFSVYDMHFGGEMIRPTPTNKMGSRDPDYGQMVL